MFSGNLDVHGEYVALHDNPHRGRNICDECKTEPLAPWSHVLCENCDKYFKNLEYPEAWQINSGYYSDSDNETFGHGECDWY